MSKNIAASVGQRLRNLARRRNEDFGLVLTKYGLERVLFRLSRSKHRDAFVLKGALLFELWTKDRHRPTRETIVAEQPHERLSRPQQSRSAVSIPGARRTFRPGSLPPSQRNSTRTCRSAANGRPLSALHRASPAGGPSVICRKLARGGTLDAVAMNALPPGVFKVIMGKIDQQKTQTYT